MSWYNRTHCADVRSPGSLMWLTTSSRSRTSAAHHTSAQCTEDPVADPGIRRGSGGGGGGGGGREGGVRYEYLMSGMGGRGAMSD